MSFALIDRFVGVRCVLTELHTENWKHRSRWTVTLTLSYAVEGGGGGGGEEAVAQSARANFKDSYLRNEYCYCIEIG